MKQNLNEQIARIKSMMKINEDDSQQMAMLQQATQEFNEKAEEDLSPEEFQEVLCSDPETMDAPEDANPEQKQKLQEFKAKLKGASIAELKQVKKQLKELRKQQNEQAETMVTLLGVTMPHTFALILGGIMLIMVLKILFSLLGIHIVKNITDWCTGRRTVGYSIRFGRNN